MKKQQLYHETSSDITTESSSTQKQALAAFDDIEVDVRHDAPLHQLQVQIDGRFGQLLAVHAARHVDDARMQLVLLVPLPTDRVHSLLVLCAQLRQFDLVDQAVVDLAASAVVLVAE